LPPSLPLNRRRAPTMSTRRRITSLLVCASVCATAPAARAQALPTSPDAAQATTLQSSYLPNDRRALELGLSPYAPQMPALPKNLTVPPETPAPPDEWTFNFRGFMSAALRVSTKERSDAVEDQKTTTLHTLPRIVDS